MGLFRLNNNYWDEQVTGKWAQYAARAREIEITHNLRILGRGRPLRISIWRWV